MPKLTLFSKDELLKIASHNIGLRLTNNPMETSKGGFGDAIPLSHLAGANDIIKFLTLANIADTNLTLLAEIYNKYNDFDTSETTCIPRLMLSYASKHNIEDSNIRLKSLPLSRREMKFKYNRKFNIPNEINTLTDYYLKYDMFMPLADVISLTPYIASEITRNFNVQLLERLSINWGRYATSQHMDYLLLTGGRDIRLYKNGYDFNRYPLGKIGSRAFMAEQVIHNISFETGHNKTEKDHNKVVIEIFKAIRNYEHLLSIKVSKPSKLLLSQIPPHQIIDAPRHANTDLNNDIRELLFPSNLILPLSIALIAFLIPMIATITLAEDRNQALELLPPIMLGLVAIGFFSSSCNASKTNQKEVEKTITPSVPMYQHN
ncbi:MAG: hypothetical protein P1U74_07450 [Legionellaceae bacterium]|nr:hypothetical protein [Legionellaceae bacterium]